MALEAVSLERVVALPHMPTMGNNIDLRTFGVEAALEVVTVTSSTSWGSHYLRGDLRQALFSSFKR